MGTDAIVEVHTPADLEFALQAGATIILINMWCRESGKLFPNQVTLLSLGFRLVYLDLGKKTGGETSCECNCHSSRKYQVT
jgi:hypothetical protein